MLLLIVLIWAGLLVAVCAICAAGGRADEERENWYQQTKREAESSETSDRDAA